MSFLNFYDQNSQNNRFEPNTPGPMGQPMPPMQPSTGNPMPSPMPGNNDYNGDPLAPMGNMPPKHFKKGGRVRKKSIPQLAQIIRGKGRNGDTILAHINPQEAMLLKQHGGSGAINPATGLPEFGILSNPKKWFKSVVGPAAGTVIGNMILPGIGGIIGGGLGGAAGSKIRGRKDTLQSVIRGAAMGAAAPTLASLVGSGAKAVGANSIGSSLSEYGAKNAILPSIGLGDKATQEGAKTIGTSIKGSAEGSLSAAEKKHIADSFYRNAEKEAFIKSLTPEKSFLGKTGEFLSKPETMLSLGTLGLSAYNSLKPPPKEKTPEQLANEKKRYAKAMQLSPEEIAENNRYLELLKGRPSVEMDLPQRQRYRKTHTPAEIASSGRHFSYYDNPNFTGTPEYKKGGSVADNSKYFSGDKGGQDDNIKTRLGDGGYVLDAYTVSDIGDGNSVAGAKKIEHMLKTIPAKVSSGEYYISPKDVQKVGGTGVLDKMRTNLKKHKRGGKLALPPKAKNIKDYLS